MDVAPLVSALGICATALIALIQLRHQREQKVKDRELETKRDLLIEGVRGMLQANSAYARLISVPCDRDQISAQYQEAMQRITVASCVASVPAVMAGRNFTDTLGPMYGTAVLKSLELELMATDTAEFERKRIEFAKLLLANIPRLADPMYKAIAAVRSDIDLAKESEADFLSAITPDLDTIKKVADEFIDRATKHAETSSRVQVQYPPHRNG